MLSSWKILNSPPASACNHPTHWLEWIYIMLPWEACLLFLNFSLMWSSLSLSQNLATQSVLSEHVSITDNWTVDESPPFSGLLTLPVNFRPLKGFTGTILVLKWAENVWPMVKILSNFYCATYFHCHLGLEERRREKKLRFMTSRVSGQC